MSEQLWYYIDSNEAQIGPITIPELQQLVATGVVTHETVVWSDALGHQWIPASNVEGLFEAAPEQAAVPAPTAVATPAPALRAPEPTAVAQDQVPAPSQVATSPMIPSTPTTQPVAPAAVGAIAGHDPYATPEADQMAQSNLYPATIRKGGSFMLWLMFMIIGVSLFIFAFASLILGGNAAIEASNAGASDEAITSAAAAGVGGSLILILCGLGFLFTSVIFTYIYIYRAWAALQPGGATITPGKAIGFMFIPLFNIVWLFIAIGGLPKQWNAITSRYQNTQHAPKLSMGMFICLLLIPVIGSILWHKQLINAINFMAKIGHGAPAQGVSPQQAQGGFSSLGGVAPAAAQAVAAEPTAVGAEPAAEQQADYTGAMASMGVNLGPKTQPIPLRPASADVADETPSQELDIPAVPNPLLGVNSQQPKPNPLLGVQAAARPNPLLANPDAVKPANKLNTAVPAPPAEEG